MSTGALTPSTAGAEDAAYTLRDLITDIPLSTDSTNAGAYVTCVDFWAGNLYIGTSCLLYTSPSPRDS